MAPIIIHGPRLFCLFYKKYIVLNITMHYTHSGTTSMNQVSCLNISELRFFKLEVSEDE